MKTRLSAYQLVNRLFTFLPTFAFIPPPAIVSRRKKKSENAATSHAEIEAAHKPAETGIAWAAKPGIRLLVSILLGLHLLGIFIAPLAARPEPTSVSAICAYLMGWFQPYLDTAYLNHGYGFFSPDPGSSLLIRYEVELPDGKVEKGVLPDLESHWPRLLYHRHFMLSSQSSALAGLPESYAQHLLHVYQGKKVKLQLVEHIPASPENILAGRKLTDPESYIVRNEATLDAEGNYSSRSLGPMPGEMLPQQPPVIPGGPTGEQPAGAGFEPPPSYRGPFAPPRRPNETQSESAPEREEIQP